MFFSKGQIQNHDYIYIVHECWDYINFYYTKKKRNYFNITNPLNTPFNNCTQTFGKRVFYVQKSFLCP